MLTVRFVILVTVTALVQVAGFTKCLATEPTARTQISWHLRINDAAGFQFRSLSVFVQYWSDSKVRVAGSFTPDENGQVTTSLPRGVKASAEITSSDPTVAAQKDIAGEVGFYRVEKKQLATVARQEFEIPTEAPATLVRTIEFQRAAAIMLCVPKGLKSGSVQFHRTSEPREGCNWLPLLMHPQFEARH
jgi:hypothetical protein